MILACACLLSACKSDSPTAGADVLTPEDEILLRYRIFDINSELSMSPDVISMPDSFMVGEIETRFGSLRAGLLTQLSCPETFRYPENAEIDSVCLLISYSSWLGDASAPLSLNVYEIDRATLEYSPSSPYLTKLDVEDYCSPDQESILQTNQRVVVAGHYTDSVYSSANSKYEPAIRVRMSDAFSEHFTQMRTFESQDQFNQFFKGLYITSDFGSSTMLNIQHVSLGVYYHYTYQREGVFVSDTTIVESDVKGFYASSDVRQVNVFKYLNDKGNWMEELTSQDTSYIIAPAGIYTTLKLPMAQMNDTIKGTLNGKRPYVNLAEIRVEVLSGNKSGSDSWLGSSDYMMLMKANTEGRIEDFFVEKELPNDTSAIISAISQYEDSLGVIRSYYSFDISMLLTKELRNDVHPDTLNMTLVPVSVVKASATSSAISGVSQIQTPTATMIRSAQNAESPMSLKVVYSGF